jgi:hypothetical protein
MVNRGKFCVAALAVAIGAAIGTASAADFTPVVTGVDQPKGVTTDASGNLFIAAQGTPVGGGAVYESLAPGYGAKTRLAPSLIGNPNGIAVDQQGNVFITDLFDRTVKEIPAATGYTIFTTIASGFAGPVGIAIDANGNLFVADQNANTVYELKPSNYANKIAIHGGAFFFRPSGVALDPQGNLFVSEEGNPGYIAEVFAAGGYQSVSLSPTLSPQPLSIAVDAQDNVFSTYGNGTLDEVQAPVFGFPHHIATDFAAPFSVAVDGHGHIFVGDVVPGAIEEIGGTPPPPVPALAPGGLALLALLMGGAGWWGLRRRRARLS